MNAEEISASERRAASERLLSPARLDDLLEKSSRTFAVSIPLLDEPTRRRVGLSYLLLRIADNFEDAASWSAEERIAALERFVEAIGEGKDLTELEVQRWMRRRPQEVEGYLELLESSAAVIGASKLLEPSAWKVVRRHVSRSAEGMKQTVLRAGDEGSIQLESMEDLREYCYWVAGIVGELLTELFILAAPDLEQVRSDLEARARTFGEALQLVNIVKDAASDAEDGRRFLPPDVALSSVFELARADLGVAEEYVELMRADSTPPGHLAFTALPVRLAWATLEAVERKGAGAKISRPAVARHVLAVKTAVKRGTALFEAR